MSWKLVPANHQSLSLVSSGKADIMMRSDTPIRQPIDLGADPEARPESLAFTESNVFRSFRNAADKLEIIQADLQAAILREAELLLEYEQAVTSADEAAFMKADGLAADVDAARKRVETLREHERTTLPFVQQRYGAALDAWLGTRLRVRDGIITEAGNEKRAVLAEIEQVLSPLLDRLAHAQSRMLKADRVLPDAREILGDAPAIIETEPRPEPTPMHLATMHRAYPDPGESKDRLDKPRPKSSELLPPSNEFEVARSLG